MTTLVMTADCVTLEMSRDDAMQLMIAVTTEAVINKGHRKLAEELWYLLIKSDDREEFRAALTDVRTKLFDSGVLNSPPKSELKPIKLHDE